MYFIDFESFSECDIKEAGAWMYSRHPSTEVLCMAYAKDDEPVQLWLPGDPLPDFVKDPTNCGGIEAHNAGFEISIWRNVCQRLYGFAEAPLFVWHDSMAKCGAHALPLSLEKAADALHIMFKKDMQGSRIMLQLSQPRIASKKRPELRFLKGVCQEWDEKFERLYAYCKQDVEVQRAISKRLAPLSKRERNYWLLTEAINLRGIHLDMALVKKAQSLMQDYVAYSKSRITEITNGELTSVSTVAKLLKYLQGRGVVIPNPEYPKQGERYIPIDNLRSATLEKLLDSSVLDEDVIARECVQLRLSTGKSSTAKLNKMMTMSDTDDRVRHNYKYYGATTGRMSGAGIQTQNLPRGKFDGDYPEEMLEACEDILNMNLIELIKKYENFTGKNGKTIALTPLDVISSCVRGMIRAEKGKILIAADYSNIEGRMTAWCAGEDWKIKAFEEYDAGTGPDLYKLAYSKAFNIEVKDVTKPQRMVGKVMELSCGFGGSKGAFAKMAEGYGAKFTEAEALANVKAWREKHPNIVQMWYAVAEAAMRAFIQAGTVVYSEEERGKVSFFYDKENDFLHMNLPSGRSLKYFEPRIQSKINPWTGRDQNCLTAMGTDSFTKKWIRYELNHLILTENLVQALARDKMMEGMLKAETKGYKIIMTIHDELVAEVPESFGSTEEFESILCELEPWATGLPIAAEGFKERRYRK